MTQENNMDNAAEQYKLTMKVMVDKYERLFENAPHFDANTAGRLSAYRHSLEIFQEAFGR